MTERGGEFGWSYGPERNIRVEHAINNLETLLQAHPRLEQFSPHSLRTKAKNMLQHAGTFIGEHPALISKLKANQKPDYITMMVIPEGPAVEYPLILTPARKDIVLMVPVLTCTLGAIDDVGRRMDRSRAYSIIHSTVPRTNLVDHFTQIGDINPGVIIPYHGSSILAENYIAAGVIGLFVNETYRVRLSDLSPE